MRIVVAECSVIYTGRGDTTLKKAVRAIIIKNDGAVSVHSDFGNKPLNYMGVGCVFTQTVAPDGSVLWSFDSRKENLQITLHHVISDSEHQLEEEEPGLTRDGTESHLQAWIADRPESLGDGYELVGREYPTGAGPVDLLMLDGNKQPVAVEVKRIAMLGAVDQVQRYVEALNAAGELGAVRGLIAALDVRPNTVKLADKRGIDYVIIPPLWRKPSEPLK